MSKKKSLKKPLPINANVPLPAPQVIIKQFETTNESFAFETSLNEFSQKDIPDTPLNDGKKKKQDMFLRNSMLVICAAVFVFSAYNIIKTMMGYAQSSESYDEIRTLFHDGVATENATEFTALTRTRKNNSSTELLKKMQLSETVSQNVGDADGELYEVSKGISELDSIRYKLKSLAALNSDTYGWITVHGLNIDYPVVQTTDNDFYLAHNFNKVPQPSGAIYADYRIDKSIPENRHTIIYGHNMNDGAMFQSLLKIRRQKKLFEDVIIEVQTMDGIFKYQVFSVYKTSPKYPYIRTHFNTDEEWVDFLYEMKSNSTFQRDGVEFTAESRIITLSTCSNTWDNGRIAVHALLIESITE